MAAMEQVMEYLLYSNDHRGIDLLFSDIVSCVGKRVIKKYATLHGISFSTLNYLISTDRISIALVESLVLTGLLDIDVVSKLILAEYIDLNHLPIRYLSKCSNVYEWVLEHDDYRLAKLSTMCDRYPPNWCIGSHIWSFIVAFGSSADAIKLINNMGVDDLISPLSMRVNDDIIATRDIVKYIALEDESSFGLLLCHALKNANLNLLNNILNIVGSIDNDLHTGLYNYLYDGGLTDKKLISIQWLMGHDIFPDKNNFPLSVLAVLDLSVLHTYLNKAGVDTDLISLLMELLKLDSVSAVVCSTGGSVVWTTKPSRILRLICRSGAGVGMAKKLIDITGKVGYEKSLYTSCDMSDREMIIYLDQGIDDESMRTTVLENLLCNDTAVAIWAYCRYKDIVDLYWVHYKNIIRHGHISILLMEIIAGNLHKIKSLGIIETSHARVYYLLACLMPRLAVDSMRDFKKLTTKRRLGRRPEHLRRERWEDHVFPEAQKMMLMGF